VRQFVVGRDDDGVRLDRWFKRHLPQVGFATVSRWARTDRSRRRQARRCRHPSRPRPDPARSARRHPGPGAAARARASR
jgi:hypothetical protein